MRSFISRQPIIMFGLISFMFSWFFWGVSPVFETEAPDFKRILDFTGLLGPSLAAVILTLTLKGKSYLPDLRTHLICFLITFSVFLSGMTLIFAMDMNVLNVFGAVIISDLAAYLISISYTQRHSGHLFRSTVSLNGSWGWILLSLISFPLIVLGGYFLTTYLGTNETTFFFEQGTAAVLISIIFFMIFGGPLAQELGWRGFVIPRALPHLTPLNLSIILGVVWSFWFLPLYFNGVYDSGIEGFAYRFIWNIPLAIFFTWMFIRSKGSILTMIVLHTSLILSFVSVYMHLEVITYGIMILLGIIVIISIVDPLMRKRNAAYLYLKDFSDLFY